MYDAIYTRQSVDRADSISVESQAEICKREVLNSNYKIYTDKGYSGKNIDRPEFQEMLRDIQNGVIRRVIVYRLDRISRSVLDFANLIDIFQKNRVDFVSTMEKFDTSTPIGKAMLMIVMIFAQLERETIQQRVADAYRSRARRGYFMGGPPPYGYQLRETMIDGIRTKEFIADPENARYVRTIFDMYAEAETSLGDIVRYLNSCGAMSSRGNPISRSRVREMLINPSYVKCDSKIYDFYRINGAEIINPREDFIGTNGGYLYSGDEASTRSSNVNGCALVLAPHEGIIDSETWLKCRKKCLGNKASTQPFKARSTWLAGKIKCAKCGHALCAKTYRCKTKEDNRYFFCSYKYMAHACDFRSLDADEVEAIVLDRMRDKLVNFGALTRANQITEDASILRIQNRVSAIETEIESLMGKIAEANSSVMVYINDRIQKLDNEKNALIKELDKCQQVDRTEIEQIKDYVGEWESLEFKDRRAVVDAMIDRIDADQDRLDIYWKF